MVSDHATPSSHFSLTRIPASLLLNPTASADTLANTSQVCIHDSTWKNCDNGHEVGDFVRLVRDEWRRRNDGAQPPVRRYALELDA